MQVFFVNATLNTPGATSIYLFVGGQDLKNSIEAEYIEKPDETLSLSLLSVSVDVPEGATLRVPSEAPGLLGLGE